MSDSIESTDITDVAQSSATETTPDVKVDRTTTTSSSTEKTSTQRRWTLFKSWKTMPTKKDKKNYNNRRTISSGGTIYP